jgi:hypothetical protein
MKSRSEVIMYVGPGCRWGGLADLLCYSRELTEAPGACDCNISLLQRVFGRSKHG